MRPGQLKRQARDCMLTPRRPNVFLVTMVYLALWFMLMTLVSNLSGFGHFSSEFLAAAWAFAGDTFQAGGIGALDLPTLRFTPFGLFFFVIPWAFSWVLDLGYLYYARGVIAKNEDLRFLTLFEGFNYFVRAILIRICTDGLTYGGLLLLLFVPGLLTYFILYGGALFMLFLLFSLVFGLWAMCTFSQAKLLLLDHPDRGAFWCLLESNRLMRGRKMEYLILVISFLGCCLLTQLPYVFAAARLWYISYSTFTYVYYYNKLTGQGPIEAPEWKRPGMF